VELALQTRWHRGPDITRLVPNRDYPHHHRGFTTRPHIGSGQKTKQPVLFRLNVELSSVQTNLLNVLNLVDIVIMVLFGIMFLALYAALSHTSRIWSAVATSLPFLGIVIFLITHTAGRSGLLIGGLIFSIIMLGSTIFSKGSAYVGIVASVLLFFAGDIGTTIFSASKIIALFIGVGYVLWMIWFFLIGQRLFRLGHGKSQVA
jgi:hypothetical protein